MESEKRNIYICIFCIVGYTYVTWSCYLFSKSICYLFFCPEESGWSVKERDRFLSRLAFRNDFRRVFVDASFSLSVTVSFPRRMVVDKVKMDICCVTSVDFICSVPLSLKDTGEWCSSTIVWVKIFYLFRVV